MVLHFFIQSLLRNILSFRGMAELIDGKVLLTSVKFLTQVCRKLFANTKQKSRLISYRL